MNARTGLFRLLCRLYALIYQNGKDIVYGIIFTENIILTRASAVSPVTDKMQQHQTEYIALYLINAFAKDISSELVGAGYCMGSAIIITSIYTIIRLHNVLNPVLLLIAILFVILASGIVILLVGKAIHMHDISRYVLEAFRSIEARRHIGADYKFWKSCRPFRMKVGSVGTIETHDFLLIMFDNILATCVILLVNF
jgi:hypothetical protein